MDKVKTACLIGIIICSGIIFYGATLPVIKDAYISTSDGENYLSIILNRPAGAYVKADVTNTKGEGVYCLVQAPPKLFIKYKIDLKPGTYYLKVRCDGCDLKKSFNI
jgi:hypothetical protein